MGWRATFGAGALGMVLVVTGCASEQSTETSGAPATEPPGTTTTATTEKPKLEAEDSALAAKLPEVPGYSYVDWTEDGLKAARLDIQHGSDAKHFVDSFDHMSDHTVVYDDHLVAVVNAYSVRDAEAAEEDGGAALLDLVDDESSFIHETSTFKDTATEKIGEHDVLVHTFDDGWSVWTWYEDGVVYQVQASNVDLDGHVGLDYVEGAVAVQEGRAAPDPGPIPADRYELLEDDSPIIHERLVPLPGYYYADPSADYMRASELNEAVLRQSVHALVDAEGLQVGNLILDELDPEVIWDLDTAGMFANFDEFAAQVITVTANETPTVAGTPVHVVTGTEPGGWPVRMSIVAIDGIVYNVYVYGPTQAEVDADWTAIVTALVEGAGG